MPTIVQTGGQACKSVKPFALWTILGVVDKDWEPAQGCTGQSPIYLFADARHWPWDLKMGQIFIWLSVITICAIFYFSLFTKKIFDDSASAFDTKNNPDRKLIPDNYGHGNYHDDRIVLCTALLRLHHAFC